MVRLLAYKISLFFIYLCRFHFIPIPNKNRDHVFLIYAHNIRINNKMLNSISFHFKYFINSKKVFLLEWMKLNAQDDIVCNNKFNLSLSVKYSS